MKIATVVALFALWAAPAWAGLIGSSITGTVNFGGSGTTNFWDPLNGEVPGTGYVNSSGCGAPSCTVIISSSTPTFGNNNGASLLVADFSSGTQLVLTSNVLVSIPNATYNSFTMTFSDPAISGATLQSNPFGLDLGFSGDTITLTYNIDGRFINESTVVDISSTSGSGTPEPSTFFLMLGILCGLGIVLRGQANRSSSAASL